MRYACALHLDSNITLASALKIMLYVLRCTACTTSGFSTSLLSPGVEYESRAEQEEYVHLCS